MEGEGKFKVDEQTVKKKPTVLKHPSPKLMQGMRKSITMNRVTCCNSLGVMSLLFLLF